MIATTMLVVTQHFNDAALADMSVTAFADHAFQFFLHGAELGYPDFNLFKMT